MTCGQTMDFDEHCACLIEVGRQIREKALRNCLARERLGKSKEHRPTHKKVVVPLFDD